MKLSKGKFCATFYNMEEALKYQAETGMGVGIKMNKVEPKHCDDYILDSSQPKALRRFLKFHRWPAYWQVRAIQYGIPEPVLFAVHNRRAVKATMASRFGDVGITTDLRRTNGYDLRVSIEDLTNFSDKEWK